MNYYAKIVGTDTGIPLRLAKMGGGGRRLLLVAIAVVLLASITAMPLAAAGPVDTPDAREPRAATWSLSVSCKDGTSGATCTTSNVTRGERIKLSAVVTGMNGGKSGKTYAWSLVRSTSKEGDVFNCTAQNVGTSKRCGIFKQSTTESTVRYRTSRTHPRPAGVKWNTIRISLTVTDKHGDSKSATYDVRVNE